MAMNRARITRNTGTSDDEGADTIPTDLNRIESSTLLGIMVQSKKNTDTVKGGNSADIHHLEVTLKALLDEQDKKISQDITQNAKSIAELNELLLDLSMQVDKLVDNEGKRYTKRIFERDKDTTEIQPRFQTFAATFQNTEAITVRLGDLYEDSMADLKALKQQGSVQEYHDAFHALTNRLELSEESLLSCYIGGLQDDIQRSVRMFSPKSIQQALCLAKLQEAVSKAQKNKSNPKPPLLSYPPTSKTFTPNNFTSTNFQPHPVGNTLQQQSKEPDSNLSKLLPVIPAHMVFEENPETVIVQEAPAMIPQGMNPIICSPHSYWKALKIRCDRVMVSKLLEDEYGKFKDILGNKLGLDDLRSTKPINLCSKFKSIRETPVFDELPFTDKGAGVMILTGMVDKIGIKRGSEVYGKMLSRDLIVGNTMMQLYVKVRNIEHGYQLPEVESMFHQINKSGEQFKEFSAPTETAKRSMALVHELLLGALPLQLCGEKRVHKFDPSGGTFDVIETVISRFKVNSKVQNPPLQQPQGPTIQWDRFLHVSSLRVLLDSVVSALLRNCSYKVMAVSGGHEGWTILADSTNHIDLVLTEVEIPSLSGIGLLTKMLSHKPYENIPLIMMSSNDLTSIIFKCLSKGAIDFSVKPVRRNALENPWLHVWSKCHNCSSSSNESGIWIQNISNSSIEVSDDNNGSNDDDVNWSTGLHIKDGSNNGSGTQNSWSERMVEVEKSRAVTLSDRVGGPADSTCAHSAQVCHSRSRARTDYWVTSGCNKEDIENVSIGKYLKTSLLKTPDISLKQPVRKESKKDTEDLVICGNSSEYTLSLEDMDAYLALYQIPTRADGISGSPLISVISRADCKTSEVPDVDHNCRLFLSSRASQQLGALYCGPYLVLKKIGNVAYTLQLPSSSKFHPTSLYHSIPSTYDSTSPMPPKYPAKVLELRPVKRNYAARIQWLIPWEQLPKEEATREDVHLIMQQYPNFDPWGQGSSKGESIDTILNGQEGNMGMHANKLIEDKDRMARNGTESAWHEIMLSGEHEEGTGTTNTN